MSRWFFVTQRFGELLVLIDLAAFDFDAHTDFLLFTALFVVILVAAVAVAFSATDFHLVVLRVGVAALLATDFYLFAAGFGLGPIGPTGPIGPIGPAQPQVGVDSQSHCHCCFHAFCSSASDEHASMLPVLLCESYEHDAPLSLR